jgi:hypothetical protein
MTHSRRGARLSIPLGEHVTDTTTHQPRRRRRHVVVAGVLLAAGLLLGPLTATAGAQPTAGVSEGSPGPICPADEGNARFVRFIYLNILFRCPDEAGLAYWTGRLDGGLPRGSFALTVDMSDENLVKNNVVPLYGGILNRAPSDAELQAGVADIRLRQADARLIARLFSSDEFYDAFDPGAGDKDEAWIAAGYQNILDRSPDASGLAYFKSVLGSPSTAETRLKAALIMELSPENDAGWTFGAYFAGLNRPPDPAGFEYWTTWLAGPGQRRTFKMWTTVLSSPEGYARAQTQPNPEGPEESGTPEGAVNKIALAG